MTIIAHCRTSTLPESEPKLASRSNRPSSNRRSRAAALLPPAVPAPAPLPRGAMRAPAGLAAKVTEGPEVPPLPPLRCAALSGGGRGGAASPARGLSWMAACWRERAVLLPPSLLTLRVSRAKVLLLLRCTLQPGRGGARAAGQAVNVEHGTNEAQTSCKCCERYAPHAHSSAWPYLANQKQR